MSQIPVFMNGFRLFRRQTSSISLTWICLISWTESNLGGGTRKETNLSVLLRSVPSGRIYCNAQKWASAFHHNFRCEHFSIGYLNSAYKVPKKKNSCTAAFKNLRKNFVWRLWLTCSTYTLESDAHRYRIRLRGCIEDKWIHLQIIIIIIITVDIITILLLLKPKTE